MKYIKLFEKYKKNRKGLNNPQSPINRALKIKSDASGISVVILKKVYKRGMAAWNAGHIPGTPQQAWAMGRVNSFITGAGEARKADADLWKEAQEKKREKNKDND